MKRLLKIAAISFTVVVTVLYLLTFLAPLVSHSFPVLGIISIFYLPLTVVYFFLVMIWLARRRMIGILLLLILLCGMRNILSTVALHPAAASWHWEKPKGSFRVMSWNVNRFGSPFVHEDSSNSLRRQMLALIRKADADILCLQDFRNNEQNEVYTNFYVNNINDVFEAGSFTSMHYPFFYEYDGFNYCDKFGVAIYSRFPLADTGSMVVNEHVSPERAAFADLNIDGKTLRVFNAHLSSMNLWSSEKDSAGLNALRGQHTSQKAKTIYLKLGTFSSWHAMEAERLQTALRASPHPLLFTADLNSVPSSYVYRRLRSGLEDAFLENGFGSGGTYNRVYPPLRIDVIFHDPRLILDQFTVLSTDVSDHNPVIADFHWKQ